MDLTDPAHWADRTDDELRSVIERMTSNSLATWSTNEALSMEAMNIANAAYFALHMRGTDK